MKYLYPNIYQYIVYSALKSRMQLPMLLLIWMTIFTFNTTLVNAQSDVCAESEAFCTAEQMVFPAGVDNGTAVSGPDYGCLGSQPNPAWFHLLINVDGDLQLDMSTKPLEDIDFICWGPFADVELACDGQLTSSNIVDCSYSPNPTETCIIPNAQVGEYYIIMITNYSNHHTNISFSQNMMGGGGQTDCSIVSAQVDNNGPVCVGDTIKLFGEYLANTSYSWTGPNGFASTLQEPMILNAQLSHSGVYSLVITQGANTSDPSTSSVVVVAPPVFKIKDLAGSAQDTFRLCYNEEMKFKAQFWNTLSVTWNNGSTGPVSSFYNTSGVVMVDVVNSTGCENADTVYLDIQSEIVFSMSTPDFCDGEPQADITNDASTLGGVFSGAAVIDNSPNYYLDPSTIPLGDSVETFYTVTELYSCSNTESVWTKHYELPTVSLNLVQNSICVDADALALAGGSPANGEYLGTGITAGNFDPSIPGPGVLDIRYKYQDLHSCIDSATDQMTVYDLPDVTFDIIPPICPNSGIVIIDQGEPEGNGGTGNYSGSQIDASGHFDSDTPPGIYDLVYEYTDANSCSDTAQRSVEVLVYPEAATSITVDVNAYCPADNPITITLECVGPDDTYVWYADDFSGSPIGHTKIIIIDAPLLTTEYLVRSETDCSNSAEMSITVTVYDEPVAAFSVDNVCENDAVLFFDNSSILSGSITDWDWDFGDGDSDNVQNPTHVYSGSGIQDITLNITSDHNCENTIIKSMEVYALPLVSFSEIEAICLEDGLQTLTQGDPVGGVYSGPGVSSANSTFDPVAAGGVGDYELSYTYTDAESCVNYATRTVTVIPMPEVPTGISVDDSDYCLSDKPDQITLSITNTIDVFKWYENSILPENLIGDETSIIIPAPETTTTYLVRSETSCGESVQASITVSIHPTPVADFSFQDECQNDEVAFSNLSTIASGDITSWSWDYGDGTSSSDENPLPYAYSSYGSFTTQLTVVSDHACTSSKSQVITIHPKPIAAFSSNTACYNDTTFFLNASESFGSLISDYSWNFNEGEGLANEENPKFVFANWGKQPVELLINTEYNCKDTLSLQLLVDSLPLPDFTFINPCKSNVVTYNDASDVNGKIITDWLWHFGDGDTSPLINPQHVYAEAASFYDVRLTLVDSHGCSGKSTIQEVYVNPDFSVSIDADKFCVDREETLLAVSNDPNITLDSWEWWVDGSLYSTADEIKLNYPSAGIHYIQLIGTLVGCTSGDELLADIKALPNTDFDFSIPNLDFPTQFTDITTLDDPLASIISWDWDFDDNGVVSTDQNPNHQYNTIGFYQVSLLVLDDNTCKKEITKEIEVSPKPVANFTFINACEGNKNIFNDVSTTTNGTILNWQWDFGEPSSGSKNFSNLKNPDHKYAQAGSYDVKLIVEAMGFDTIIQTVRVYDLPETQFNWSTPCLNEKISLNDMSIAGDGNIDSWSWNISDGTEYDGQNMMHVFPSVGNYSIKLLTIDDLGCKDSLSQTISILQPPSSAFDYSLNCLQSPTEFVNQSDQGSSAINIYQWSFGDGENSNEENPQHIYINTGTYQTSLLITNNDGCRDSVTRDLVIRPLPEASFDAVFPLCEGLDISFNNSSTGPGAITSYLWNMGDGTTYTTSNVIHSYAVGGDKDISLIISDDWSCLDTMQTNIYIVPEFELGIDYFGLCTNTPANITGVVIDPPIIMDEWDWLFHDGTTASGKDVVYTYKQSGDYNLQLTARKNGCEETYTEVLSVNPSPTADFIFGFISLDDTVPFFDKSTLNGGPAIIAWDWDFDDPLSGSENTSSLQNAKHLFSQEGDFDVTLIITDANGCSDDTTITLTVNPRPVAGFMWDLSCFGTDVQFVDTSSTSEGFITDWYWDFGDPASGAFNQTQVQNPTHAFTAAGIYNVQLVVKAYGYDTIIHQVQVYEGAAVDFSYNNPCQGNPVNFIDETIVGDAPIESWFWNFADGTTSTLSNPTHTYQFSGDYLVELTVIDTNACENTMTHNVIIWQGPTAKFNHGAACAGSLTYFIDKTTANGADIIAWDWSFGDPGSGGLNFSTEQNPSHEFASAGIYQVILIAEDANGCIDQDTVDLVVEPAPIADFMADSVCIGETMTFIDQSTSNGEAITSWYWEFGDGATTTISNPLHTYASAGNYDVLLVIETAAGCSDEIIKTVQVHYLPTANYTWSGGTACENDTTHFTDLSAPTGSATIDSWLWQFGDGMTSTEQHPDHYYANAGNYAVTLLVTDIHGCQNSMTQTLTVSDAPVSNFIYDNSTCDTVWFTSTGFDPNGLNITNWYWDFGDPTSGISNTSTEENPYHQYINGGVYQIMHVLTNESGCTDTTYQSIIISKPQADFSFSNACSGIPINFNDESTATGDPVISWNWDFNDGSNSTQQNPSHIFTVGGTYLVSLTVATAGGCESQIAYQVDVDYGPTANFTHTSIHCTLDSIQFTDVSTGNASLVTWEWQFGDGSTSTVQNPIYAYANSGTYLVNLRVIDENGCFNDKSENFSIDQSPIADFNWDIINCDTTFFTDLSNDNGTNIIAWSWHFDDIGSGANNISFEQHPSHKFSQAGNFEVQLSVRNQHLCTDTISSMIAYDAQPDPDFVFDTVCLGDTTHFIDITSTDYQNLQGWEWSFGDGQTSAEQNPNHQYLAAGIYQVKLKVINSNLCTDSIIKDIVVHDLPIVYFSPDSSCFGEPIAFIDETNYNGTPNEWLWDFGDGSQSGVEAPVHTYATDGTYQVSLTVTELVEGTTGCSNSYTKSHYVNPLPIVDFTFDSVCIGTITQFTNLSSSPLGIQSYFWDFDDGTSATVSNPTHTYAVAGSYNVKLIITDFMGCIDSIEKPVNVYDIPVVAFDAPTVCLGDSTEFADLTAPTGAIWNWSFGDGSTSDLQNPKHLYANAGSFSVLLEVESAQGCANSIIQDVEVLDLPIVDFSWNFAACANDTVFFEDLSQGIGTDIVSWDWNFGDGTTHSPDQHPWHIYAPSNDTFYQVTLIVNTTTACVDSLKQIVNITGVPVADFSFTNNSEDGPCINNQFNFIDESQTQSGLIQNWFWDFGDGQTSNSQNPIHFFASAGTYTVSLTVNNTAGCDHTSTQDIFVFDLPIVDFTFDSVCLGDTTHFNDSDEIEVLATQEWNYIFGDGSSTELSDPTHFYISPGEYSVILQITDTNLCRNEIQHQVPVYGLPNVDFTFDTVCLGMPTQYTDLTQIANHELANWNWSFGDAATGNTQNPEHIFIDFGAFNTQLIVTDAWGCTDSLQKLVHVYEPPIAHFNWSDTSCTSGLIYFNDSSYHTQGHQITDFLWTINGFETSNQNPQYTFPTTEVTYPISLNIIDARGCKDTVNRDIFIDPELQVSFIADTVCFGNQTRLIAYPTKPIGASVEQWSWYFDDGSDILITSNDTVYHEFLGDGNFRVELQGQNSGACSAEILKMVKVRGLPLAAFKTDPAACLDSTIFKDESVVADSELQQWRWYFGDGNSQIINKPDDSDTKYLYPPYLSTFEASLSITDEYGCIDSVSNLVPRYPCIFVNFYTDTSIYCQNKAVTFIDSSYVNRENIIISKYWDFGDGSEVTTGPEIDTVNHIYENTGIYQITYILTFDEDGLVFSDTARKEITVFATPIVTMIAENICDNEQAFLVSNTNANGSVISSWKWSFGDGTDTTIISHDVNNAIYHTYPHNGAYDLQLMALTDLGCRDTANKNFIVNPLPKINFIADTNVLCGPGTILFTDSSTIETGTIIQREWYFGDGTSASRVVDTITHRFNTSEFYTIALTNTSDSSCTVTDSVVDMISLLSLPIPDFTVFPDSVAITAIEDLVVNNLSENAYYYEWLMADTIYWEDTYEPHIYNEIQDTGHYKLQLYAQNVNGCWDSTESYFKVYPVLRFYMPNAFSPNGNGINETYGPQGKYFEDKTYSFQIFNRWGELMFETHNFYQQWDGFRLKDGSECPIGVYAWVIEVSDLQGNQEVYKGHVTLVK